jgi:hypothetical protein
LDTVKENNMRTSFTSPPPLSFAFVLTWWLWGCGTQTQYMTARTSPKPLSAKPSQAVELFLNRQPTEQYVELGFIQGRQASGFSRDEMPEIITEMRSEAGKRGCEGLIISGKSDKIQGGGSQGNSATTTLEGFIGSCIVFTDRVSKR